MTSELKHPYLPESPGSMTKGGTLKTLLDHQAIEAVIHNISLTYPEFDGKRFDKLVRAGLEPLTIKERGLHFARAMQACLPNNYEEAIEIILGSLTAPLEETSDNGMAVFFYLPHVSFVKLFGADPQFNGGKDPFETSMKAQYELTKRFTAEFSIRTFIIKWPERTLERLMEWSTDEDPHVRRLCSEGSRPRLPWAEKIPALVDDPKPVLPILEALKDDPELYVRRSVANHLGDIAKDNLEMVLGICSSWLQGASKERKWLIRHALRHPAKKGNKRALELRALAK